MIRLSDHSVAKMVEKTLTDAKMNMYEVVYMPWKISAGYNDMLDNDTYSFFLKVKFERENDQDPPIVWQKNIKFQILYDASTTELLDAINEKNKEVYDELMTDFNKFWDNRKSYIPKANHYSSYDATREFYNELRDYGIDPDIDLDRG
jgi:hypothetical protein